MLHQERETVNEMSYAKTVAELRKLIRQDVEKYGLSAIAGEYSMHGADIDSSESEEAQIERMVAFELELMGK